MSGRQIIRDEMHKSFSPKFSFPMSAPGTENEDEASPNAPLTAEPAGGRVWQACLACRRKKVRREDEHSFVNDQALKCMIDQMRW